LKILLNDLKRSELFEIGRRCISEIVDERRAFLEGGKEGKRKKLFLFSVLPAIFAQSCAQGVTDLWPANRLFLNARKMHSLPSERSRENEERENYILLYSNERERERLFRPSSIFLTIFISKRERERERETVSCPGQESFLFSSSVLQIP